MLVYICGQLRYSPITAWAAAVALLAAPIGWHLFYLLPTPAIQSLLDGIYGQLLDYALAATLLSSFLWALTFSFTTAHVPAGRPELIVLRAVSAAVAAHGACSLVASTVPRPLLVASAMLYTGLSVNLSCWWASIWLSLQSRGLAWALHPSLLHALKHERPIDWLRRDMLGAAISYGRRLVPLMVLPEEDVHHGLALMPPRMRALLERPGLAHLVLPDSIRLLLLEPWAKGPPWVRVRSGLPGLGELVLGAEGPRALNGSGHQPDVLNGAADADAAAALMVAAQAERAPGLAVGLEATAVAEAAPQGARVDEPAQERRQQMCAPEWLLLYALRRHCVKAISKQLAGAPLLTGAAAVSLAMLAARGRRRRLRSALLAGAAAAAATAVGYVLAEHRRRMQRVRLPEPAADDSPL